MFSTDRSRASLPRTADIRCRLDLPAIRDSIGDRRAGDVASTITDLPAYRSKSCRVMRPPSRCLPRSPAKSRSRNYSPSLCSRRTRPLRTIARISIRSVRIRCNLKCVDGFIRPTDESIVDDIVQFVGCRGSRARSGRRGARELQDVDTAARPQPTSQRCRQSRTNDLNFQIDSADGDVADELPAGEVDGGMVLLQSTGDANESGFDLTPVYAEHVGAIQHAGQDGDIGRNVPGDGCRVG